MATAKTAEVETIEAIAEDAYVPGTGVDVADRINGLNSPVSRFYSSIEGDDWDSKKAVAAAMANSEPISDHLKETISLHNFIVQAVEIADDKTGELNESARVTLIAEDGKAYHGTSVGLISSVESMLSVFGKPSGWPQAIDIQVIEDRTRRGFKVFTFRYV